MSTKRNIIAGMLCVAVGTAWRFTAPYMLSFLSLALLAGIALNAVRQCHF